MGKHKRSKQYREGAKWKASAAPAPAEPAVSRQSAFQCPRCTKTVENLADLDDHNLAQHLGSN